MKARTARPRRGFRRPAPRVAGKRILITGAARGIGAALARQLHVHGAQVALLGIEESLLAQVAAECGDAPWRYCDVGDPAQVERDSILFAHCAHELFVPVALLPAQAGGTQQLGRAV